MYPWHSPPGWPAPLYNLYFDSFLLICASFVVRTRSIVCFVYLLSRLANCKDPCKRCVLATASGVSRTTNVNRPRSIYQYSNMAPRLSGQTSIFGVVFFVSKSPLGIEGQKNLEKFAIFTRKPRSHAWILIYRTWPILRVSKPRSQGLSSFRLGRSRRGTFTLKRVILICETWINKLLTYLLTYLLTRLSSLALGGKMRDPGNEVESIWVALSSLLDSSINRNWKVRLIKSFKAPFSFVSLTGNVLKLQIYKQCTTTTTWE